MTWWLNGGAKLPAERIDATYRRLATERILPAYARAEHRNLLQPLGNQVATRGRDSSTIYRRIRVTAVMANKAAILGKLNIPSRQKKILTNIVPYRIGG